MYLIDTKDYLLGVCSHGVNGWRFIPNVTSRRPRRKAWPSTNGCIPKWAFDASDELLTCEEWKARKG